MSNSLDGRVCIVTGGSRGIGRSVAEWLVREGALVVVGSRTQDVVRSTVGALNDMGPGRALGVECDVRQVDDCTRLIETSVAHFGGLDVLVNNAGIGIMKPIQDLTVEEWRAQVETNLNGVFYCTKAAVPHLQRSADAWIIQIASLASRNTFGGGVGYNASKFGLLGMTEAMMLDLRHDRIRVSTIMPGSVQTEFGGRNPATSGDWRLQGEDVARAVVDLLRYPGRAHPSRVELRPSMPPKK